MPAPDLNTPEGLRAYRAELHGVARGWRWIGLGLVTLSAIGFVITANRDLPLFGSPLGLATIAGLVIGWSLAIVGIVKRTRHHRRRMSGWDGDA